MLNYHSENIKIYKVSFISKSQGSPRSIETCSDLSIITGKFIGLHSIRFTVIARTHTNVSNSW